MDVDSTRAPVGATTLTTKEIWDAAFAAWEAAKVKADFAYAAYSTARDEADALVASGEDTGAAMEKLTAHAEETGEALATAFKVLVITPAPDFAAVLWKMTALYGEGDCGPDDEHSAAWRMEYPGAVIADLERLQSEFANAWLAAWTTAGGSVIIGDDGKVQASYSTYDLSPVYRAPRSEMGEEAERQDGCWNDGHYYGTMKALFEGLRAVPGGGEMVKANMRAKGLRIVAPIGTGAA